MDVSMCSNKEMLSLMYSGDSDPNEWFKSFEVRSVCAEWDADRQLEIIGNFLDSKAKRLLDAAQPNDKDTYAKVKKLIIDGCAKSVDAQMMVFLHAKRLPNEPVSKYARRLQEMLVKATPNMDNALRTTFLRSQLCNAVPENLRALIQFSASFGEGNWDKILDMLDKTLPVSESGSASMSKFDIIKTENIKQESVDTFNTNLNRGYQRPNQTTNNNTRFSQPNNNRCYTCGGMGHRAANCNFGYNARNQQQQGFRPQFRPQYHQFNSQVRATYPPHNGPRGQMSNFPNRQLNTFSTSMVDLTQQPNYNQIMAQQQQTQQYNPTPWMPDHHQVMPTYGSFQQMEMNVNDMSMVDDRPLEYNWQKDSATLANTIYSQMRNEIQASSPNVNMQTYMLEMEVALLKVNTQAVGILLKLEVMCSLFNIQKEIKVIALIDCGSTHSLMSPDVFSGMHKKILLDPSSCWVTRRFHRINGVLGGANSECYIVSVDISFRTANGERWCGEHEFVISSVVRQHEMILGRDFLKANKAVIDHGKDFMLIDENIEVVFLNSQRMFRSGHSSGSDHDSSSHETDAKEKFDSITSQILELQEKLTSMNVSKTTMKIEPLIDLLSDSKEQI